MKPIELSFQPEMKVIQQAISILASIKYQGAKTTRALENLLHQKKKLQGTPIRHTIKQASKTTLEIYQEMLQGKAEMKDTKNSAKIKQ